ncbi:parvulin-like peptidyl-prolyl cis-trans isomerase protein [Novosphingobium kunmingense]|uniref:Parvulin-like peptidyl-prolyl cis-trans isomerase protein n=1 Tax=Novosphingobium kunmingense TaxID=1211806 RepID=A0A2N0I266_9SPHN|nr:peptidylprolyl isomerase [Novosphingobium kunmingense]PKB25265.1 parvulin-like peptidyl-prolyl cis-trans isomerase protein [Novosphingobium kunmingense]
MKIWSRAGQVLREPLVHFLVAGAILYVLLAGRPPDAGDRRIVVDEAAVGQLAARFAQSFRRPPSPSELDGMIADHVRDQAYYREALRLGLDKDDEVVVRRMRNKMLALAASEAQVATPTDAQLQALIDESPARFAPGASYTLDQAYLGADDAAGRKRAVQALAQLRAGAEPTDVALPAPLPAHFTDQPASVLASTLGDGFVAALETASLQQWSGPIASGVGLHAVRVMRRTSPGAPRLADVRQAAENAWRARAAQQAQDAAYKRIVAGYDVVIEMPE